MFRHVDVQRAWQATRTTGRPMLVFVTSNNCAFCKKMVRETFAHPQIRDSVVGSSEPVVLNASHAPELAKRLGVRSYPTTLVISSDSQLLQRIEGFVEPQEFADRVWPVFVQTAAARQAALANPAATIAN
ncbi:MAG: thioredoxin family protein [Pirellulales bacterium]|nr:thioredoxin family protein [Pirellulales bacterium]